MVGFPAFVTPAATIVIVLLPYIIIPMLLIAFVVWHVRKLNKIDRNLEEILKRLRNKEI